VYREENPKYFITVITPPYRQSRRSRRHSLPCSLSNKRKNALSPAHGAQGSYLPLTAVLLLQ